MPPPLFVIGSGGHAREIAAYFLAGTPPRHAILVDSRPSSSAAISIEEYHGRLLSGDGESILGSGRCDVRRRMLADIRPPFATFIHPSAVVLGKIRPGSVVAPNAVIGPWADLAEHVLVNYGATVGHDTIIGELSVIGPNAAVGGFCSLERQVYVGAGALIREKLTIGAEAVIGMGAVVTHPVASGAVMVGSPARPMPKSMSKGEWLR